MTFHSICRETDYLLPLSEQELLPDAYLARSIPPPYIFGSTMTQATRSTQGLDAAVKAMPELCRADVSAHPVATPGQLFYARPHAASAALLADPKLELTYNGRGALHRACLEIVAGGRSEVLLPGFHCPSGVTPVLEAGLRPVFYRITRRMEVDFDDLLSKIGANTAAVVVIHFFGLPTNLSPLLGLRERGVTLIEDWSHSFLEGESVRLPHVIGDYAVFSFWKLVPSGVGGGLWRANGVSRSQRARGDAPPLHERMVRFKRMLEESLDHSDQNLARTAFRALERARLHVKGFMGGSAGVAWKTSDRDQEVFRGEDHYEFDTRLAGCRMPGTAYRILAATDFSDIVHRRRANFRAYFERLPASYGGMQSLVRHLPDTACPWIFPLLLEGRDAIDHEWQAAGVSLHTFGIWLHSALLQSDDATRGDARFLADRLLCLSVHQGLSLARVERSADILLADLATRFAT